MNRKLPIYKILKWFKVIGYNKRKNLYGMSPLVISTGFIILTEILASLIRKFVEETLKDNFFKQLVFEFIATAELCAACFELIIVAEYYGVATYAFYLFLLTIWWSKTWKDATACPYNPIEEIMEGTQYIYKAVLIIISQIFGGIIIFKYVQYLWGLELSQNHRGKVYEECSADLNVPMAIGAAIEGTATCLCRLISRYLNDAQVRGASIADAFFATSMVVAAFNFSGGYFNPALASSLKFGCDGHTFLEHMVVYWLGATIGAVLSVFIYRLPIIQKTVRKATMKTD